MPLTETKTPSLNMVTLNCLTTAAAKRVAEEFLMRGNPGNTMRVVGGSVEIRYFDKRWPLDITNWALRRGLANETEWGKVIRCL